MLLKLQIITQANERCVCVYGSLHVCVCAQSKAVHTVLRHSPQRNFNIYYLTFIPQSNSAAAGYVR